MNGRGAAVFWCLATAAAFISGLMVATVVTERVARAYAVSSDDATGVLEADAVLKGNVLLRGWTLSNVSFYATDLPFYVAGVALSGLKPALLRDVPVAVYLTAFSAAMLVACGRGRGYRGLLGVATVFVLLGLPAGALAELVTRGYIRVGTSFWLFAALLALDVPAGGAVSGRRIGVFAVLLTLTILSDTYALVVGGLAVLTTCVLGLLRGNPYGNFGLWAVSAAVAGSAATAQALTFLIRELGGYRVYSVRILDFLAYRDTLRVVIGNAANLAANLTELYRCVPFTEVSGQAVAVWISCLAGPGLVLCALVRGIPAALTRRRADTPGTADFVGDVLWVMAVLSLVAYLASSLSNSPGTMRYMIPFMLAAAVLTGRVLTQRVRDVRPLVATLAFLGLGYAATVRDDFRKRPADDTAARLAVFLDRLELRHGYGPFWDASVVTASGGGRVAVRPVQVRPISPERHSVEPMNWMSDSRWYAEGPVTFCVFEPEPAANYQFGVTERNVSKTFGTPAGRYAVGPYVVLVWGHDLRPFLGVAGSEPVKTAHELDPFPRDFKAYGESVIAESTRSAPRLLARGEASRPSVDEHTHRDVVESLFRK